MEEPRRTDDCSIESLLDFYENAPCGFHALDAQGIFVSVNETELNWLGYRREEILGHMRLTEILTPESQRIFAENFPRFMRTGVLRDLELEWIRRDGTIFPVLVSATAIRDDTGTVVMSRSVAYDLTYRQQEDRRFRSILEAAPDAMLICNQDGDIVLANTQCEKVFGYRPDELYGRSLSVLMPERFRKVHAEHFGRFFLHAVTRPMGKDLVLNGLHKDGSEIPVEISLSPLHFEEGLHALAAVRDVTERRRMESELRRNEVRYRSLFENSMDGILLTMPDGTILDANPSACAQFGRTREEIIAAGRQALIDMSDPATMRMLEERKRTGKARAELRARKPDGSLFPVETASAIFKDMEGCQFTCIVQRDISEKKRAELEREQMIQELKEALTKVKVLSGLLSICASCKKIRDEQGKWEALEVYIRDRSAVDFTHGLCSECFKKLYPDFRPR